MLQPGDVLIIPSGAVHELFAPADGGSRCFVMIDRSEIAAMEGMMSAEHCFYPCVHINTEQWDLLQRARASLDNAVREYETDGLLSI